MKQIVSLSGGKDSTAMLLMMLERGEQVDDIVFFDWGMEFPEMYAHLEKLEDYIGRPVTRLYPKMPFEYWMFEYARRGKGKLGYGWPGFKVRWCSREKSDSINRQYRDSIMCCGYAYDERFTRAKYHSRWFDKFRITLRYPLLEWGVVEEEALKYCYAKGFDWGGLYNIFKRVSCWCCPFQNRNSLLALKQKFPELWNKLLEMDCKSPFPHPQKKLLLAVTNLERSEAER